MKQKFLLFFIFISVILSAQTAQNTEVIVTGNIVEEGTNLALEYVVENFQCLHYALELKALEL